MKITEQFFEEIQIVVQSFKRLHEMVEKEFIHRCKQNSSDDGHKMQLVGYNFAAEVEFSNEFLFDKSNGLNDRQVIEKIIEWNKKSHAEHGESINQGLLNPLIANFLCGMDIYKKVCSEYEHRKEENKLPSGIQNKREYIESVGDGLLYNENRNLRIDGYLTSEEKKKKMDFVDTITNAYYDKNGRL